MEKVGKVWSNLRKGCHTLFHPEGVAHSEGTIPCHTLYPSGHSEGTPQAQAGHSSGERVHETDGPALPSQAEGGGAVVGRHGNNCVSDTPQVVEMAVDRDSGMDVCGTGAPPLARRDSYSRHAPWGGRKKHASCSSQTQSPLDTPGGRRGRARGAGLSRQYGGGSCEGAELSAGDRTPSPRTLGRRLQDTMGLCLPLRPRPRSSRDPFPSSKRKIHLTELMLETCPFPPGSDLARKWHLIKRHTAPISSPSSSSASAALLLDSRPSPEDEEERLRERRRLSIEEGVDPPPDAQIHSAAVPTLAGTLYKLGPKMAAGMGEGAGGGPKEGRGGVLAMGVASRPPADCDSDSDSTTLCLQARRLKQRHTSGEGPPAGASSAGRGPWKVHTQIDYIHCLVPDLLEITGLPWYWGVMDRYQAEALLEGKPEGTFLLRDSAQEDYLFSVSFRRYGRSLHARVEQWNHNFSFDAHDPCVFHASTVTGLLEHYKDPGSCMFFEPLLTTPLHRTFPFSLQRLARATVCRRASYDAIGALPLPTALRDFLREYHYKQKVRVRWLEREPLQCK